ncbi:unnamed protein product [Parnassius apollo]|uniref:(apollo) hypothetical protein n=1 Tax=Parnassius apollo TaxID=110799 RepID=A0A8S3X014_PARAO|nr:unnamed protein product [Parnassius apollo]
MCKGFLLILTCTASISSIVTHPFHSARIEVAVDDMSERDNNLYLVILNGQEDSNRNIKTSEHDNNYYEVPMKLLYNRRNLRPHVEIGPGVFKSDIVQYPADDLKNRLQYLMKLKEKLESRT